MKAFVWFVPRDYAVYFEASSAAEAWKYVQQKKKRWAESYDLPGGKDSASWDERDAPWFEQYPRSRLGGQWPGVVKQTPAGTLYSYLGNSWAPEWCGRERWTTIHTNGQKAWIDIDEQFASALDADPVRSVRNSERQRFTESIDANNERRNRLSIEGWQRQRVK